MVQAERKVLISLTLPLTDQLSRHICQQGCRCWSSILIGHHRQLFPLKRQSQNRFRKIIPMDTDYPARPKNQVPRSAVPQCDLTISFGPPIDTERVRKILFRIGSHLRTIEHIISGVMYDLCAQFLRFRSEHSWGNGIDGMSQSRL